jgi:hypothetical protein
MRCPTPPQSGAHLLALVDDAGRIVDRVLFTVRVVSNTAHTRINPDHE